MEKTLVANLRALVTAYRRKDHISNRTISSRAYGNNTFLDEVLDPGSARSFTVRIYDVFVQWFSDNWPEGAAWPAAVIRPKRARRKAAPSEAAARR